ncbi:flagellar basal-body rod protein FlgG [Ramlibacter alkalitolerans]|uniref:Flagellar basal-body rod protein FlgG n=1 Tax=Ramlibacter alkalitolerans TaxID=2039631 RepID=A0ABS1JT07_9BURK|nr:flagellar basal-body rod protein FlgG [Ramlibacter alkalitolerans]MBL0427400.1 flagellar basal-body rod protein FlgG [Ramlibacter alkalitolerans]
MLDALAIGATGMQAHQAQVDAIANNLANVNTSGFKKNRTSFSELVVAAVQGARGTNAAGLFATGSIGAGVQLGAAAKVFDAGELRKTDAPLDLAIVGDGFLELAMPDGTRAYARGGSLKVNADGQLASQAGVPIKPGIAIPDNAESVTISATGRVQVRLPGQATPVDAGQLELARFANPQGLLPEGANVYRATEASGEPIGGRPGEDGMGTLAQGALESSNVKLVEEMVNLMVAQRAYEASVKVVQASDEMLGMINGLRR